MSKDSAPEPATSGQEQTDWPPEDGEWFFVELIRELPLIIGVLVRLLLRLNKEYWLHVWVGAVGWRIGWHVVDIGEDLFPYSALLFTLMMYGFHELFLRMLCGIEVGRAVPLAPALLFGILVRVLYVSVGGLYTFIFLGVTQTPFVSALGRRFPEESEMLERALTPVFIVCLILGKHISQLGFTLPGVFEPHRHEAQCVWLSCLVPGC